MPLNIDLLHEHHQQELERRTDPLRLGVLGLLVVAVVLVSFYMVQSARYKGLQKERSTLNTTWASKQPLMQDAAAQEEEYRIEIDTAQALITRAESRLYWGPLLEQVLRSTPPNVQIQTLAGNTERDARRFALSIAGLCAGQLPRQDAENFRQALLQRLKSFYHDATVEFTLLEDMPSQVNLDGQTYSTARFTLALKVVLKPLETSEQ